MAIDTAAKRSSCLDFEEVWTAGIPFPDGAVAQADRQHLLWSYSGILVGPAAVSVPGLATLLDAARTVLAGRYLHLPDVAQRLVDRLARHLLAELCQTYT